MLYNSARVQRATLEHALCLLHLKELVTISVAAHDLDVALAAYIDSRRLLIVSGEGDEFGRQLWVGAAEEPLEMFTGQSDSGIAGIVSAQPTKGTVQRTVNSPLGDLIHQSSRRGGWESYLWRESGSSSRRTLSVCRPQDFNFTQEGSSLTVHPKARTIYCVGIDQTEQVTLVTAIQNQPESAEVFTGHNLSSLRRRMVRHIEPHGSRIEMRVANSTLTCSPHGMHWSAQQSPERLRMLPDSLTVEINHKTGTAQLTES
jgi:hypothetical protein